MRSGSHFVIDAFACTHVGRVRKGNEDSFFIANLTERILRETSGNLRFPSGAHGTLLAVADGMGGAAAGETASRLGVQTIYAKVQEMIARSRAGDGEDLEAIVSEAVGSANSRIYDLGSRNSELEGMGTTLTLAFELQGRALIGQIGDSRAYLIRADGIRQLTRDQSLTGHKVDMGELTEEEARHDPERNILLQALGVRPTVQLVMRWITLSPSDVLLLCSDGLHSQLSSSEIHRILLEAGDLESAGLDLVDLANRRGGPDNITAVLAQFLPARASDYDDTGDEQPSTLFDWRR